MALVITIDGNTRTDKIQFGSLKIKNILTNKRDTCKFVIVEHSGDTYIPKIGEEVIITDSGTKIFAGIIKVVESRPSAYKIIHHNIECADYTALLDRKLVPDTFENQTIDQIITSLKASYFPTGPSEITINNVDAPPLIDYISFSYKPLAKVLEQLANTINYDWYIDYDRDLHFKAKSTSPAPFDINDGDGSYDYESLIIRSDNTQLRNTIIVRGGKYLGSQITVEREADGDQAVFPTRYQFNDFSASVTGEALNVGVDYINDADDFDALYNFNEKVLRFKDADKPSSGAVLKVSGKPNLPVIVKLKSQVHIDATRSQELGSGVYEYLVEDKKINTKEGARQRAEAEVLAYAETLSEGEFVTETSGLQAGMQILINSTSRGISKSFIINKVTTSQRTNSALRYEISLITTRTFDLIDVLQKLLLESTEKIEIAKNELVDLVESFPEETISFAETIDSSLAHNTETETISMSETFTAQSLDYEVEFVAGPWLPNQRGDTISNILGYWKLNDDLATTNVIDSSGNGNDGTLTGGENTENISTLKI